MDTETATTVLTILGTSFGAILASLIALMVASIRIQHRDSTETRRLITDAGKENRNFSDEARKENRDLIDQARRENRDLIDKNRDLIDKNRDLIESNHGAVISILGDYPGTARPHRGPPADRPPRDRRPRIRRRQPGGCLRGDTPGRRRPARHARCSGMSATSSSVSRQRLGGRMARTSTAASRLPALRVQSGPASGAMTRIMPIHYLTAVMVREDRIREMGDRLHTPADAAQPLASRWPSVPRR